MKKRNRIIEEGYDFEVLYNWDCLQRIARHPKYEKLCKDLDFDKDVIAVKESLSRDTSQLDVKWEKFKLLASEEYKALTKDKPSKSAEYLKNYPQKEDQYLRDLFGEEDSKTALHKKLLERIRIRFGLITPIRPDFIRENKYPPIIKHSDGREESLFSAMPIFHRNPFAVSFISSRPKEDKDGNILLNPIHEWHFLVLKIDVAAHFKSQIVSGVKELIDAYRGMIMRKYKIVKPCRRLKQRLRGSDDEISMTFKIDLLADEKDIISELHKAIGLKPSKNRYHLEKRINYYEIWDERAEGVSFPEIAQEYGIKLDTAKKRFQCAFELIFDRNYYHDLWWKLFHPYPSKRYRPSLIFSSEVSASTSEDGGDKDSDFIEERVPANSSFYDDPQVRSLWLDIQKSCSQCREECKPPLTQEDIEEWRPCPKIMDDLTEDISHESRQFYLEKSRES